MRFPIIAMVAALSLTGCVSYSEARQDYLQLRADGVGYHDAQRLTTQRNAQRHLDRHTEGNLYSPVVDFEVSTALNDYEHDLRACNTLAHQRPGAGTTAAGGAVAGFLGGAVIGKAVGLDNAGAGQVARAGAITGGVTGGASGASSRQAIVANCLSGRGWAVVGG